MFVYVSKEGNDIKIGEPVRYHVIQVLQCSEKLVAVAHQIQHIDSFMRILCVCGMFNKLFSWVFKELDFLFSVGLTKPTEI